MKKTIALVASALLLFASCASTQNVKYVVANHYFVNNDVDDNIRLFKVTDRATLDKYFGMAAVMGKNGEPTKIDFSKEFAIGVTMPVSDGGTEINPVEIKRTGDKELTLYYSVKKGTNSSYSVKPMFLVKVDNKYKDFDIKEQQK